LCYNIHIGYVFIEFLNKDKHTWKISVIPFTHPAKQYSHRRPRFPNRLRGVFTGSSRKKLRNACPDVVAAGLLGIAASAGLPEVGIQATPEIITYAAAIGFNLPTFVSWALGNERFWSTSLPMGMAGAGIGAFTDAMQVPINANSLAKTVLHNLTHFGGSR
jgi:hypothetical protein